MKKTVQVNLSGQVFTLDEDAYDLLSGYLKKIGRLYERSAGKDEILSDIELRIAELLLERNGDRKEVVSIEDVQAVIEIMGNPEDFEENEFQGEEASYASSYDRRSKRLYRDPDNRILGGVCSGIGYYFGIDPIWIRLVFAIALIFFGTGVLLYVLLWLIIPQAKTTAEKLNMRGEPVNIDSIGKTIEEEMSNLGERFSKTGEKFSRGTGRKIESGIDRFFHFLAELFRGFFTVLGKVLGGVFLLVGLFAVVMLLIGTLGIGDVVHLGNYGWNSSYSLYEMTDLFLFSSEWVFFGILSAILTLGVPFLALAYGGMVLLFPQLRVPYLGASLAGLWFIGIILAITFGFGVAREFSKEESITDVIPLDELGLAADTIQLSVGEDPFNVPERRAYHARNDFMMRVENRRIIVGNVEFDIRPANNDRLALELHRTARAGSYEEASQRVDSIRYHFDVDSSSLSLDAYFSYPQIQLLRSQEVRLVLRLPEGKTVFLANDMKRIIDDIENVTNTYDPRMTGHHWKMTSAGLECTDCKTPINTKVTIEGEATDASASLEVRVDHP